MPETIMIILQSDNILSENNIYYPEEFQEIRWTPGLRIPATSFVERRNARDTGFVDPVRRCLEHLCEFFPQAKTLIGLCAQNMFFPDSAVVRSRGLWKSNDLFTR